MKLYNIQNSNTQNTSPKVYELIHMYNLTQWCMWIGELSFRLNVLVM